MEATTYWLGFIKAVVGGIPSPIQAARRPTGWSRLIIEIGRAAGLLSRNTPQPHAFVSEENGGAGEQELSELEDRIEAPALKKENAPAKEADRCEENVVIAGERRFKAAHEVEQGTANGQHDPNDAGPIQTGINHSCVPPATAEDCLKQLLIASLRSPPVASELAVHLVGLAQQEEANAGGDDHDHSAPNEAAQKVGEGGGHVEPETMAWIRGS